MNERGQAGRGLANRVARAAVPVHLTGGVRLLLCEFSYAEDSAAIALIPRFRDGGPAALAQRAGRGDGNVLTATFSVRMVAEACPSRLGLDG
jgi:hypothetical protein